MAYENNRPNIPAEIKRQIMTEAGHRCSIQHCEEHIVEIHHIDQNRENNNPSNLIVLCDKHHKLAHEGKISRMDLKKYKELLISKNNQPQTSNSTHDINLLTKINNIFSYNTILLVQNENFGSFVRKEVIDPFYELLNLEADPLFKFTDSRLEQLKNDIIIKAKKLMQHFGQQSAGLLTGYQYIDINQIRMTHPELVNYWINYSEQTVDLAQDFCTSMLLMRAELIHI